ncbi:MAG: hypothetical protein WCW26_00615 [Candidatus Buchananbacteria bacterium]
MIKLLNWALPGLTSFTILILLEEIIRVPKQIYWLGPLALTLLIISIWQLTGLLKSKKFLRFSITPVFLFSSGLLFLLFLEGTITKQLFSVVLVVLLGVFLEVIFVWFHLRPKYQPNALENISAHLNLITIFLTACGFFSLIVFLNISVWVLALGFFVISAILNYQLIWISGTTWSVGYPYITAITVAITEIFLAASFLPTSFYVSGLIVTVSYYLMTGLAQNWLIDIKEARVVKRYLLIGVVSLIIILITAKWF